MYREGRDANEKEEGEEQLTVESGKLTVQGKRLIDANALYAKAEEKYKNSSGFYRPIYRGFVDDVADAPTVDAVEVVRCKDCVSFEERYRTPGGTHCGGYCYHWDYETGMSPNQVDGDDFCSYGERREGE